MESITKSQFEKIFKSSFTSGHNSSQIFKTYQNQYPELLKQSQFLTSSKTHQNNLICSSTNPSVINTAYHQQPLLGSTTFANESSSFGHVNSNGFNSNITNFNTSPLNYNFNVTTIGPLANNNQVIVPNSSTCLSNINLAGTRVINDNSSGDQLIGFNQPSGFVAPMGNVGNTNYGCFKQGGSSSFSNYGINHKTNQHALVNYSDNNGKKSHLEYLPQYSPTNQLYGLSNILGGGGGENSCEFKDNTAFNDNSDLAPQQFVNDNDFINTFSNQLDDLQFPSNIYQVLQLIIYHAN